MLVALLLLVGLLVASPAAPASPGHERVSVSRVAPSPDYPLEVCVVTGDPLAPAKDRRALDVGGQEIQVCCAACQAEVEARPESYLAKFRELLADR